jgi:hypothetical protein
MPAAQWQRNASKVREANFPPYFIPEWKRKIGPSSAPARQSGPSQHFDAVDDRTNYYLTSTFSVTVITWPSGHAVWATL